MLCIFHTIGFIKSRWMIRLSVTWTTHRGIKKCRQNFNRVKLM